MIRTLAGSVAPAAAMLGVARCSRHLDLPTQCLVGLVVGLAWFLWSELVSDRRRGRR